LHAAVAAFDVDRVQFVLFVHDSVVVMATDVLDALRGRLVAEPDVGLVAPMLLEEDLRTVSDVGVAFALETTRPSAEVSWWREDAAEGRNAALPHAALRGVPRTDARVRALSGLVECQRRQFGARDDASRRLDGARRHCRCITSCAQCV
jgi:hypothetical protein